MQNNNQPIYATLDNQVPTPIDSFYAIAEPSSVVYSDDQPSSTKSRTSRSSKKTKISKRKQVKNACINCQKACKKCDEGRACQRCVKLGIADSCVDSPRKERLKGVKRGPYKKRQRQNDELNQIIAHGQEIPFEYDQAIIWDNSTPVIHRQQKQQQQSQSQSQPQPYYQQDQHQGQASISSSPDLMLGHEQLSAAYYSPPISQQYHYQQSSLQGTPSPLMNSFGDYHQYNNSPVASSLSTSPASSTMLLPQDTLQSILTLDDMIPLNLSNMPLSQDMLYTGNDMMMMPLQTQDTPSSPASSSFAWSACTPSPTTASFASQSQPQQPQCLPYQQDYDIMLQQPKQEQALYWEPSSISAYDLSLSYAPTQPYM
ncbi:unnamed protein product [Absidia cylindrospora]